jgi:hypothetical protein
VRNVFAGSAAADARSLAAYVRRTAERLESVGGPQIIDGLLAFPEPHAILAGDAAKE